MPPRKKVVVAESNPAGEEDSSPAAAGSGAGGMGIDQYELPKSVIARLAKGAVPAEVKLQKEVPLALVKSSTVFINYLAALSHDLATDKNTKTITALHVLEAVRQLGWEDGGRGLEKELKRELKAFRKIAEAKKAGTYVPPPRGGQPKTSHSTKPTTTTTGTTTSAAASGTPRAASSERAPRDDERPEGDLEEEVVDDDDDDVRMEGIELYSEGEGQDDEGELEGFGEDSAAGVGADGIDEPEGAAESVSLDDVDEDDE